MSARATAWAWQQIAAGRAGTVACRLVLLKLADRADDLGKCWPGHERTAADLQISERAARDAALYLEKCGLLLVERRQDRAGRDISNMYRLPLTPEEGGGGRGNNFPPGRQDFQGGGNNVPPNLSDESNKVIEERETPRTRARRAPAPAAVAAGSRSPCFSSLGVWHQQGNERDDQALEQLAALPPELVQEAASLAAAADPRATAWPGPTLALAKRLTGALRARQEVEQVATRPVIAPARRAALAAACRADVDRRLAAKAAAQGINPGEQG